MRGVWQGLNGWRRLLQEAAAAARAQPRVRTPVAPGSVEHTVALADTPVRLCAAPARRAGTGLRYLNLHENEQTSVEAARAVLRTTPGSLIELHAGGRRLVVFRDGLRPFAFDPNRIFTDAGLVATLRRHGSDTPAARAAVQGLRAAVLALLDGAPDEAVVALHNNGAGAYSVHAYGPGGVHAADGRAVAVNPACAPQDFFLVTRRALFDALGARGFNVVLQSEQPADDGSLAVWFQRQGRAYVNVEALHGHVQEQQRMLAAVAALGPP